MNFMSKSKSYLLYEDTKSIKKRISFGLSNRSIVLDNSISLEHNSGCVLQKVNSHECLSSNDESVVEHSELKSSTNIPNKSESVLQATDSNYAKVKSSKKSLKISSKVSESANSMNNLNELKRPSSSILSSIVSPVGFSYRSKLSKLMKNRLNKSQITLDSRKGNQDNNPKENFESTSNHSSKSLNKSLIDQAHLNMPMASTNDSNTLSADNINLLVNHGQQNSASMESLNSSNMAKHSLSTESIDSTIVTESNSKLIQINELDSNVIDCEMELAVDVLCPQQEQTIYNKPTTLDQKLSSKSEHSSSKLSKLNRSISSSILSINKFKRKKTCRQSMQFTDQMNVCENVQPAKGPTNAHAQRKSLTSKNLLKQIENLHEQTANTNSENKTLHILINIYNSELTYLNHLKNALEIYAEPLRKFSSLTPQEYNLLFANLEPIISLSCNLSIKLENLINNYSPYALETNTGNLLGKKLFECYEEYINSYTSIVKLLNQKFKQNEIRELCELRQSKSSCTLSLHETLSLPLERIIYYQKLENDLIESYEQQLDTAESELDKSITNTELVANESFSASDNEFICSGNNTCAISHKSKSAHNSIVDLSQLGKTSDKIRHNCSFLLRNKSVGDIILNQNNDCIEIDWNHRHHHYNKMKSDSLVNLNDQLDDMSSLTKLASLVSIQQTFPNDDLKLFDQTVTPTKFHQATPQSASSLTQTVKSVKTGLSKLNLISNNTTTPVSINGRSNSIFSTLKKSEDGLPSKELFTSRPKLSESCDCTTPQTQRLARTQTITTSADSHLTTTLNSKATNIKKKASLIKQTNANSNGQTTSRTPSFVAKHFQIQRRKTIHDIVNFELLNSLISTDTQQKTQQQALVSRKESIDSPLFSKHHKSQLSLEQSNSVRLNKIPTELTEESGDNSSHTDIPEIERSLIKQSHVILLNQYDKQDRYLFLFNDLLIIAKQKNESHNKLKYRVLLSDIWLSDCFDTIYWQYKAESSIVIGWPPAHNFIADFKSPGEKDNWLQQLKELISIEKQKQIGINLNIKICFNKDNFGGSEPTQYSECFTKTVQVRTNETAQEIVDRCKYLFGLEASPKQEQQPKSQSAAEKPQLNNKMDTKTTTATPSCSYQLWLKTGKSEPLIPLIGHEFPFVIKMNFLREAGRSIKDDDNSLKFILIDKNSRKSSSRSSHGNSQHYHTGNRVSSVAATDKKPVDLSALPQTLQPKDADTDAEKLQKMRKKMFWSRTTSNADTFAKPVQPTNETTLLKKPQPIIKSISVETESIAKFKTTDTAKTSEAKASRGANLSHAPSYKQQRSESVNLSSLKSHLLSSKMATNITDLTSHKLPSSSNATLKPFYSKLKKTHLFGIKLEKLCGVYGAQNCKLPVQIMSLLRKVSDEGQMALMIFRKSASAKLKKIYKEKLDSNQTVDYAEMNVHVAALLLKEYLRDYPDGIIDYQLYNECLAILKISEQEVKDAKTKALMSKLPRWNLLCLRHFMCLFCSIVSASQVNKMDSHNLSVCVAPSIFHKLDRPSDVESSFQAIAFIKHLIDNCETVFGKETMYLLGHNPVEVDIYSEMSVHDVDSEEMGAAKQRKGTKSKIIHHKEIGRMLNFALKGKKSSKSKSKAMSSSVGTVTQSSDADGVKSALSTALVNVIPTVVLSSPPNKIAQDDDETLAEKVEDPEAGFDKISLNKNKEIRRRTSTNNSDQKAEFNTMLVVNDEEPEMEDDEAEDEDDHGTNQSFNSDEENDDISDQEDYYTYNDDIVEISNEDGITLDYGMSKSMSAKSRYKQHGNSSKRSKNLEKANANTNNASNNCVHSNTDSNNETSLSVNNLVLNNKHDLSSNTLSVDSGLSVPTATNSDPESEKSTNVVHIPSTVKEDSNLDASRLKQELEKHQQSADYCCQSDMDKSQVTAPLHLKRQKRMMFLNTNTDSSSNSTTTDTDTNKNNATSSPAPSESEMTSMKSTTTQNTDSFGTYNKSRRISSDKIAPLAPVLQQQEVSLIPYNDNTLEIPETYKKLVKSHSQNRNKRLAPIATAELPKTEESDDYIEPSAQQNNQDSKLTEPKCRADSISSDSTSSISSSKSTSTENHKQQEPTSKQQVIYYSSHQYQLAGGRKNAGSGCNRGKSIAKVNLNKDSIADMLSFNYMYDGAIGEGNGLACDHLIPINQQQLNQQENSMDGSSTTIYVPYIPKKQLDRSPVKPISTSTTTATNTSSVVAKERRKLSKTIRDYKPSRQLQRQLSHQQTNRNPGTKSKLVSQSFKHLKSRRRFQVLDTESSTEDYNSSNNCSKTNRIKSKPVMRAKSLNSQLSKLTIFSAPPTMRSSSIEVNEQTRVEITFIEQKQQELQQTEPIDEGKRFVTRVYSNPANELDNLSSKTQSLSSASSVSISSNQSKIVTKLDNNNNHSINLNDESSSKTTTPTISKSVVLTQEDLATQETQKVTKVLKAIGPSKAVEVTWSVSSIRKQFEQTKLTDDNSSDHNSEAIRSNNSSTTPYGTIKINRHSILRPQIPLVSQQQNQQQRRQQQQQQQHSSTTPRHSTSSFSSVSSNSGVKFYNYQDSNGNPITYI